jgi:hypothetical protein
MQQEARQPDPTPAAPVRRFLSTAVPFCAGLAVTLLLVDAMLGGLTDASSGRRVIGREVYEAARAARTPRTDVTTLYLGDSVARQLFRPGAESRDEPGTDVRYLTSNFAISLAGQYYLLEDALAHWPRVREVNLVLVPGAWQNDLDTVFTDDYFCGFFHRAGHIAEVFRLKRDWRLSTAHVSRWLLPNLLAHNAARRPQAPARPVPVVAPGHPADPWVTPLTGEPLLALVQHFWPPRQPPPPPPNPDPPPPGAIPIRTSPVSRHYLARMKTLCAGRNIRLRILPGPCPDTARHHDAERLYDADFFYVGANRFSDTVHLRPQDLDQVRRDWIRRFGTGVSVRDDR